MKNTKKAICALRRVLLLILILSLALTGCGQEEIYADEYPNWYYGSIFDPQSSEYGKPLVTYQTLSDVLKTVDENGKCSLKGKFITLMKSVDFTADGTIDPDIVRLAIKGDCSYYEIMGQLRKQGGCES